ncbi:MAG: hypothetical protein JXC32_08440 [Anaerolineae bacterium]|nr:hypothetical protein [Anaerolineae bacterium]
MNKMIGFDRKVQLAWLDAVVALVQQRLTPDKVLEELRTKLARDIEGMEAQSKTMTVLLRIWVNVPPEHEMLRAEALDLMEHIAPDARVIVHWGMALLAYPFFRDVAATMGTLGRLQDVFTMAQVQRRMVEGWGQRTTLERAVQRVVRTVYEWDELHNGLAPGAYRLAEAVRPENQALALWLLHAALVAHGSDVIPLQALVQLPYLFPFDLASFLGEVRRSPRFAVTRQGLDLEMVAVGRGVGSAR